MNFPPKTILVSYTMKGILANSNPPYQAVFWTSYNVPDYTGQYSNYFGQFVPGTIKVASGPTGINGPVTYNAPGGPASGDLDGYYPNPIVVGLQGRPISDVAPILDQQLIWNGDEWIPANTNSNPNVIQGFNVLAYGATGNGSADDTAAILATISAAVAANNGIVYFPPGVYLTTETLTITSSAIVLQGAGSGAGNTVSSSVVNVSEIHFTGSGDAIFFDGGATGASTTLYGCGLSDLSINGNSNCTNCLRLRNCHHGAFKRYQTINCTNAGTKTEFAISNIFEQPRCSTNENTFITIPTYGMWLGSRGVGETTTSSFISVPIMEGITNGILDDVNNNSNTISSGTCEGCDGYGLIIKSINCIYSGMDLEANTTGDIQVDSGAFGHIFASMQCISTSNTSGIIFNSGSYNCSIISGEFRNVIINAGALDISFSGSPIILSTLIDNGTNTKGSIYGNTFGWTAEKMPGAPI